MLWIALHFPELSLEAVNRTGRLGPVVLNTVADADNTLIHDLPLVVTEGPATRPVLHATNAAARDVGINAGMTLASARAMEAGLIALPRDVEKEADCLRQVAAWVAQFTPSVTIAAQAVLLEVQPSLRLFGGIARLVATIRKGMVDMGFHALVGVAPTPLAATLLARTSQYQAGVRMCRDQTLLRERLADVPLPLFQWPHSTMHALSTLGFTRFKDLLPQPREGLRRRFGDEVVNDIDRALGMLPDPRPWYVLPEHFHNQVELVFEISESERLLAPLAAMLTSLEGFLRARGAGVTHLNVSLKHNREQHTRLDFDTRTPARAVAHWMRLVRERFAMTSLELPVVAITLRADTLQLYVEENESFLPTQHTPGRKWEGLFDRLSSRLGPGQVFAIATHDDHRPEAAWQLGPTRSRAASAARPASSRSTATHPAKPRPAWLLPEPRALVTVEGQPQHHGALRLLAGPERIETGWWDGKPVTRDYFVAQNPAREVCWVYRDYRQEKRWFLHGLFA